LGKLRKAQKALMTLALLAVAGVSLQPLPSMSKPLVKGFLCVPPSFNIIWYLSDSQRICAFFPQKKLPRN
jgi:hypothetical protein